MPANDEAEKLKKADAESTYKQLTGVAAAIGCLVVAYIAFAKMDIKWFNVNQIMGEYNLDDAVKRELHKYLADSNIFVKPAFPGTDPNGELFIVGPDGKPQTRFTPIKSGSPLVLDRKSTDKHLLSRFAPRLSADANMIPTKEGIVLDRAFGLYVNLNDGSRIVPYKPNRYTRSVFSTLVPETQHETLLKKWNEDFPKMPSGDQILQIKADVAKMNSTPGMAALVALNKRRRAFSTAGSDFDDDDTSSVASGISNASRGSISLAHLKRDQLHELERNNYKASSRMLQSLQHLMTPPVATAATIAAPAVTVNVYPSKNKLRAQKSWENVVLLYKDNEELMYAIEAAQPKNWIDNPTLFRFDRKHIETDGKTWVAFPNSGMGGHRIGENVSYWTLGKDFRAKVGAGESWNIVHYDTLNFEQSSVLPNFGLAEDDDETTPTTPSSLAPSMSPAPTHNSLTPDQIHQLETLIDKLEKLAKMNPGSIKIAKELELAKMTLLKGQSTENLEMEKRIYEKLITNPNTPAKDKEDLQNKARHIKQELDSRKTKKVKQTPQGKTLTNNSLTLTTPHALDTFKQNLHNVKSKSEFLAMFNHNPKFRRALDALFIQKAPNHNWNSGDQYVQNEIKQVEVLNQGILIPDIGRGWSAADWYAVCFDGETFGPDKNKGAMYLAASTHVLKPQTGAKQPPTTQHATIIPPKPHVPTVAKKEPSEEYIKMAKDIALSARIDVLEAERKAKREKEKKEEILKHVQKFVNLPPDENFKKFQTLHKINLNRLNKETVVPIDLLDYDALYEILHKNPQFKDAVEQAHAIYVPTMAEYNAKPHRTWGEGG